MPGLTIREFTISTKVTDAHTPEIPNNQSVSENKSASPDGSNRSYPTSSNHRLSIQEKENIVRLCVDKVLEILYQKQER